MVIPRQRRRDQSHRQVARKHLHVQQHCPVNAVVLIIKSIYIRIHHMVITQTYLYLKFGVCFSNVNVQSIFR